MNWQDKGFLLSINKFNENSSIADFYTENKGKVSGILFGSSSKKIKNYLLIGNRFHINYNSKTVNSIGNFKIEIDKIYTPLYLDDRIKLSCIVYSMQIIKMLTVENQSNNRIYSLMINLFDNFSDEKWIKKFIFWELELLKLLGYELLFSDYTSIINKNSKTQYVSKLDNTKIIPSFLIENKDIYVSSNDIINAFSIVGDFLQKSILNENNYSVPSSRQNFENLIKEL